MVVVETSFPRGGTVQPFKTDDGPQIVFGAKQTKIKSTKKQPKEHRKRNEEDDKVKAVSAELLSHKTLQEGMIVMGRVKTVDSTHLKVSLPGRIIGKVFASSISHSYTSAISKYVEGNEDQDKFKTLNEMFAVGQIVYTKVTEIYSGENEKLNITLSLLPADLHSNLYHMHVCKGMIFNAAVQEIQEHGYVMETGIKNLRCFVPAEKQNQNYGVGQLVCVKVDKVTASKNASTIICKDVQSGSRKVKDITDPKLDYIVPTTVMHFTVTKILKDGLQGTIMNGAFVAYINEHHLETPLALPNDYKLNATYNARLLYVMPLTKLVYLSLNLAEAADLEDLEYQRGDIVENAIVHHIGTGGIIFNLPGEVKGLLSFKSIKSNFIGNYDQNEILAKYSLGSKHKLRIIEHDPIDNLYICSDNPRVINEKFYTVSDLKPGDFVTAKVLQREKSGNYLLSVGNVHGLIEDMFLEMNARNLKPDHKFRCRVLSANKERKIVHVTNLSAYMNNEAPVLLDLSQAKQDMVCIGTVVKSYDKYFLVKFFNDVKGVLYKNRLNKFGFDDSITFYEGQTTNFRIIEIQETKVVLDLIGSKFKTGHIYNGVVTNVIQNGLEFALEDEANAKGLVPVRLLSDFPDLVSLHLKTYKLEQKLKVACVVKNIFSVRDVDYISENPVKCFKDIKMGDILRGYIKNVSEDVIDLLIPLKDYKKLVKIHIKMFVNFTRTNCNIVVVPDQVVYLKVLSKESTTKTLSLTARLTDVWNGNLKTTADITVRYMNELDTIQKTLEETKRPIGMYRLGQKISGTLVDKNEETKEWTVELPNGVLGVIKKFFTAKDKSLKRGQAIQGVVIWVDYVAGVVYLSHNKNDINRISETNVLPKRYKNTTGVKARILHITNDVIVCSIKKGQNPLIIVPTRVHFNDFSRSGAVGIIEGEFCRLSFIHDDYPVALFDKSKKLWNDIELMNKKFQNDTSLSTKTAKLMEGTNKSEPRFKLRRTYESIMQNIRRKNHKSDMFFTDTKGQGTKRKIKEEDEKTSKKKKKELNGTSDESKASGTKRQRKEKEKVSKEIKEEVVDEYIEPVLPGADDFWSLDTKPEVKVKEESSDDEVDVQPKKRKKLTPAEKFQASREEEVRLREIEESYLKGEVQTADQFDRLVLSNPNNSVTWINYMVFHLQATEIDKARNVARRALKAINFREEDELLNIWVALLNLELRYGTDESFEEVLGEALLCNDQYKIYSRCLEILADAKKEKKVDNMAIKVTRKFNENPEIWKIAATAYFKVGYREKAQQLLTKALAVLEERNHVNTIVTFANLNHKYDDKETAYALLENVVVSYPKRVDVWCSYVDILVKDNLIDSARTILDRAVVQKIALKKMRTLFKKYLEFEEKYGDEESVQKVKTLASEFVKNAVES